jgi:hypothetical protein
MYLAQIKAIDEDIENAAHALELLVVAKLMENKDDE